MVDNFFTKHVLLQCSCAIHRLCSRPISSRDPVEGTTLVTRKLFIMSQSFSSGGEDPWRTRRRYARVPIVTPVEIYTKDTVTPLLGQIENLSVGGALASCREIFGLNTELAMLFQLPRLPTDCTIRAFGRVIYAVPRRNFGVAFSELDDEARRRLEEFTRRHIGHGRRSSRVPHRTHLTIMSDDQGSPHGEPADTVLISRNGGLLVCRATFHEGQEIHLRSGDGQRRVRARVVYQHVWMTGGLVEIGFEFVTDEDFWQIDFVDGSD